MTSSYALIIILANDKQDQISSPIIVRETPLNDEKLSILFTECQVVNGLYTSLAFPLPSSAFLLTNA